MGSVTVLTQPEREPVTLDEVKQHGSYFSCVGTGAGVCDASTADDDLLVGIIVAARMHTEAVINRKLIAQTVRWSRDRTVPQYLEFPVGPVISVTAFEYLDNAGVTQTIPDTDYFLDSYHTPSRLYPAADVTWPSGSADYNSMVLTYVAGYSTLATAVPLPIRHAILMLTAHLYVHREAYINSKFAVHETPSGYHALLGPYRDWLI